MKPTKLAAVFVDRDGVLNTHLPGAYVQNKQMLTLIDGAASAVRRLNDAAVPVIIISNQQGVGKKLMSQSELADVNRSLSEKLEEAAGARISRSYYCTHLAEEGCRCRKPKAGLIEDALRDFHLDPQQTAFIGDSETDMVAAAAAGLGARVLALSGATKTYSAGQFGQEPDHVAKDLSEAVEWLI